MSDKKYEHKKRINEFLEVVWDADDDSGWPIRILVDGENVFEKPVYLVTRKRRDRETVYWEDVDPDDGEDEDPDDGEDEDPDDGEDEDTDDGEDEDTDDGEDIDSHNVKDNWDDVDSQIADSIDLEKLAESDDGERIRFQDGYYPIPPEDDVAGHASNLQVWAENNYDTLLLYSRLAFPILKALAKAGDEKARRLIDTNLELWFRDGSPRVRALLFSLFGELFEPAWIQDHLIDLYAEGGILIDHVGLVNKEPKYDLGDTFSFIGSIRKDEEDYAGAAMAFRKAIALAPETSKQGISQRDRNLAFTWRELGWVLDECEDIKGAIEALRKVVTIEPDRHLNWRFLSDLLEKSGDKAAASRAFQKFKELSPR
jgi:tetratricopeptide (TPR) repeat protein